MNEISQIRRQPAMPPMGEAASIGLPTISSSQLLAGSRELLIHHGDNTYRLKLTGSNKLILTK